MVVEHSYYVSVIAGMLARRWNEYQRDDGIFLEIGDVMMAAALHDAEEAVTGDLPNLVKRSIKSEWERAMSAVHDEIFADSNIHSKPVSEWMRATVGLLSSESVYGNIVKNIIKAADLLAALLYLRDEQMCGNRYVEPIVSEITLECRKVDLPGYQAMLDGLGFNHHKNQLSHL